MQKCLVKHNNKKKNPKLNPEVDIIYDPCYKYSRRAKEQFFKNVYCSFLFVISQKYLTEVAKDEKEGMIKIKLIKDMAKMAKRQLKKQKP